MPLKSLKRFAIPSNISTYLSRSLILITVATTFLIAGVLIVQQTLYFNESIKQKSRELVDEHKIYIQEIVKNELEYIRLQDIAFKHQINNKIKANVNQAIHLAESICQQYQGKKSEEEIKSLIIAMVSSLKFNMEFEEVFIASEDGFGVAYPRNPGFTGMDMRWFKDENGLQVVQEEINLLKKSEEGFLEYNTYSENQTELMPNKKVTFVKKFGHFNWYFGSKQYVNDFFPIFREEVAQKISSVRFRHGGYVFMNEIDGTPIVMNGKEYKGDLNFLLNANAEQKSVFLKEVEIVNSHPEGEFFNYQWNKMGETALSDKSAYVQLYKDYGWIVGAGFYIDEIEKSIKDQQDALRSDQKKSIIIIVLILVVLLFFETVIIYHFNKRYKADFDRFFQFFFLSPKSFDKLNVSRFYFDEFKKAGNAANEMIMLREEINNKLIKEQKRATESDRLKSAFLANMSHEIRTPMNAILGFSELLEDDSQDEEDKVVFVRLIRKNGEILLNLINDIIDISKIEANQLAVRKKTFNLKKFLNELEHHYFEILASKKGKEINFTINNLIDVDLMIDSDEIRLRQILDNLIGNSIKFTSEGSVYVEVKMIGDAVHFSVSDTGIGIAEKQQQNIFERFIQAEHGHNINFGGTGLGLAISKNLVELLGGHIGVESEEGKGSTFYFDIQAN